MSLDLAQPRALRPMVPAAPEPASSSSGGAGHAGRAQGDVRPTPRARTAIHMRLTEDVLRELLDMARKGPAGASDGALSVDFGAQPAFVVNGVRHALSLHPEAPNSELVRLSSSSRDLHAVAAVTHRASVQHNRADLDKAGQRARENRELAEKEKDSRRAVLLDSAPSKAHARSASLSRPTRPHTPLGGPASAPSSRTASPASTTRQPSRLTAVPPKPPTSSTFRIGKGTVPSSIGLSRGASSSSSSGTGGGAASPPATFAASQTGEPAALPQAARQNSASSSTSSSSSETSLLQKVTSGASVTSPESLPLAEAIKSQARQSAVKDPPGSPVVRAANLRPPEQGLDAAPAPGPVKSPVRAGGGVLKGKETLKKEKRREERAKDRAAVPAKRTADGARPQLKEADLDEDEDAPGEPDVEEEPPARPAPAKKRRLDPEDRTTSAVSSRASSSSRNGVSASMVDKAAPPKTKVVTKVVPIKKANADRGSASEASRSETGRGGRALKAGDDARVLEGREGSAKTKASPPHNRKKKTKPTEIERWYSSSSSEENDDEDARSHTSAASSSSKAVRRPSIIKRASLPLSTTAPTSASPLRNSTSAATLRESPPIIAPPLLPPATVSSAAEFSTTRSVFYEHYAAYAVAHSRLMDERHRLERGDACTLGPGEIRRLVQDVMQQRAELEALREGMKAFVANAGGDHAVKTA